MTLTLSDDQMTTAEAAQALGKSRSQVTRLAKAGRLPVAAKSAGKCGAYLFDRDGIEQMAGVR